MKTKYSAKMRIFLFLLMICITAGACSENMEDMMPEVETVNSDDIGQNITAAPSDTVLPTVEEDAEDITVTDIPDEDVPDENEPVTVILDKDVPVAETPEEDITVTDITVTPEEKNSSKEVSKAQKTKIADKTIRKFAKNLEKTTDIPTILVYTEENAEVVSREDYVNCTVYTINCEDEYRLFGSVAGIRVRGNSTAFGGNVGMIRKNQVPYRIKFDKKTNLFGLNDEAECKSWVLLRAEYDLLKNDIAFRLGRTIIHEDNYCSDGMPVHVYLNGTFKGVYELCEQSQINKNRINISETPKDYEGTDIGYLVEIDNYGEKPNFTVNYAKATVTDDNGVTKQFKTKFYSVKSDVYSTKQTQYIKKYINNVFTVLYEACENGNYYFLDKNNDLVAAKQKKLKVKDENGNLKDPAEVVAEKVIDLDSVVDLYLVYEITKDRDVGEGSFYMYADFSAESEDHRLTFTCPWDFEWAYEGSSSGKYAAVFNTESFVETFEERSNPWFILLIKQDWFKERVIRRWTELRTADEETGTDPISKCFEEERELLNKYNKDLAREGNNACKKAENLISWTEKRIKWLDGWLIDDQRDQT
ncbi:MAG: CotH kinase family protein [Lachnospiraceae bacterium]|nr:CotH kinase family protein [Lachnospiraceae bacterium]